MIGLVLLVPMGLRVASELPIDAVPDVTNVTGAQVQLDDLTREASVDYQVDSVYSEEPFSESVEAP